MTEHADALLPRHELGDRGVERVDRARGIVRDHDLDDAVGVRVGERPQQQRVDDREHRGVRRDAQGKHGNGGDGEATRASQQPRCLADIANHVFSEVAHLR
jgi:hypothetical protein